VVINLNSVIKDMKVLGDMTPGLYAFFKRNPILIKPAKWGLASLHLVRSILYQVFHQCELPVAPNRSCDDTGRWVRNFTRYQAVPSASIQYVHQPTQCRRKVPGHLGDRLFGKFSQNLEFSLPSTFVAQIPSARVLDEGFVVTPDNQLLNDVSVIIDQKSSEHRAFRDGGVGPVHQVRGKVAVLASYAGRGYYHWMIDLLPRLELIRLTSYDFDQIDKFIVNCYLTSYQIETLTTLGIPREKLIRVQLMKHLSVEQLILPSLTNVYQAVPKWSCDFINESFLGVGHQRLRRRIPIYISRKIASRRHIVNEAEIVGLLHSLDFEIVTLENMAVSEQARLFQNASVVIGPHGAGLTNLVFCESHTKVLEIMHPEAVNLMFWTIASHRDLDYNYFFAKGNLAGIGSEVSLNSNDMEVDVEAFKLMLKKMDVL
jgi:capsular polysaccharide biosynthesis protein